MDNKVIVVARSSQWKLQAFLSSEESSDIVNLLVIGESLTADPKRVSLYDHHSKTTHIFKCFYLNLKIWILIGFMKPLLAKYSQLYQTRITN